MIYYQPVCSDDRVRTCNFLIMIQMFRQLNHIALFKINLNSPVGEELLSLSLEIRISHLDEPAHPRRHQRTRRHPVKVRYRDASRYVVNVAHGLAVPEFPHFRSYESAHGIAALPALVYDRPVYHGLSYFYLFPVHFFLPFIVTIRRGFVERPTSTVTRLT